jgi:hypothetical protein
MATTSLYPLATKEELQKRFVGKSLKDVDGPAAVFDISKLKNNCLRMLEAVDSLDFGWRAHIKTHKVRRSSTRRMIQSIFIIDTGMPVCFLLLAIYVGFILRECQLTFPDH